MAMLPREDKSNAPKTVIPPVATKEAAKETPAATPAPAPAASTETAVAAAPAAGAVAVARKVRNAIKENFENKMQLEWNTLPRIQANQGNFLDLERNKEAIGDTLIAQLMSFQPTWQISPGTDDDSDTELVRYSDDGVTTNKGEDCKEYLAALIASGRTKAKMSARYMMALVIEQCPKTPAFNGKVVQIDMSQQSKNSFDQFMLTNGYAESRGMITPDVAERGLLKMTTRIKTAGKMSWTVIDFDNAL
jgi:hypothetical protein